MFSEEVIQAVPDLLQRQSRLHGDKVAYRDDCRGVTYKDLVFRTDNIAAHLANIGLHRGDRVVLHLEDRVETIESYLALTRIGAVGVCVNPASAEEELQFMVHDCGARAIIVDQTHLSRAISLRSEIDSLAIICVGDGEWPEDVLSFNVIARESSNVPTPPRSDVLQLDEVGWIVYTSGTTGRPKGVLLTQRSCLWMVAACWVGIVGLSSEDVVLSPLPLFHSYALVFSVLAIVATGASERIMRFSTTEVIRVLRDERITFMAGVPTMFHYLVSTLGSEKLAARDLRLCVSAGAILPIATNEAFEQLAGVRLLDGYGITETSTMVTLNSPTGSRKPGSCGLPVPGVNVRVVDPLSGIDVDTGNEGEIWVSGPSVMVGYLDNPRATEAALQDGWYRTGDLGRLDADGYLTISGRIKELIIRGGENIYPAEVEQVLLGCVGIVDAAVLGEADPALGEVPVAFLVVEKDFDSQRAIQLCEKKLSPFKVPIRFRYVDQIPRTGSGKIMRHRLRVDYAGQELESGLVANDGPDSKSS